MPIYEYRCEGCGHQLDKLQSFSDAPLVTCPACDADLLKRLISATSFHLKGGGWYATDYKKGGGTAPAPAESKAAKSESAPTTTPTAPKSESASSSSG